MEIPPTWIAACGATVSAGISWFVRVLWLRFVEAEARREKIEGEVNHTLRTLEQAKRDCETKHLATSVALARVEMALEMHRQCPQAECPFLVPPRKETTRIKLRDKPLP